MSGEENPEASLTRSEEQLQVATRRVVVGRAVLRKTVVTEEHTVTVRLRHEEAHLDIEAADQPLPIDDLRYPARLALPEFVLYREEVVVTTRLVPVERVRLHRRQVTGEQQTTVDLRTEQIDLDHQPTPDRTDWQP